jgi:hypothetical protein
MQLTYLLKYGYLISSRVVASVRCKGGRVLQCCMAFGRLEVDSIRTRGGRPMQVKHTSKDESSLDRLDPQYYRNSSAHTLSPTRAKCSSQSCRVLRRAGLLRPYLNVIIAFRIYPAHCNKGKNPKCQHAKIATLWPSAAVAACPTSGQRREMIPLLSARQKPSGAL